MYWLQIPAPSAEPDPLLTRVIENVRQYEQTVPSLAADENIHSELQRMAFYRASANATATIAVISKGGKLQEVRTYLTANGKPVPPHSKQPVPFEYTGGFGTLLSTLLSAKRAGCYDIARAPQARPDGTVLYSFAETKDAPPFCRINHSVVHGFVHVDPVAAEVSHVEVAFTPSGDGPWKFWLSLITADYVPAVLAEKTYWLPTKVTATLGGSKGFFVTQYSTITATPVQ